MTTFLLVTGILLTFSLLMAVYRCNTALANMEVAVNTSFITDKALPGLNRGGKWLTLFGGAATFPLVIGLIFFSEYSVRGIVYLGIAGCLALVGAAMLLIPAFLGTCLTRHIQVKRLLNGIFRSMLKRATARVRIKSFWLWSSGALLVFLFLTVPIIEQLVSGIIYVIGFIVAARLGLFEHLGRDEDDYYHYGLTSYNYATGEWDDGYKLGGMYVNLDD